MSRANELNSAGQRRCHRIGTPNIYLCAGALKNKKSGLLLLEGSVLLDSCATWLFVLLETSEIKLLRNTFISFSWKKKQIIVQII